MDRDGVVAAVINYNTAGLTRLCTQSLLDAGIARVLLLDNASAADDFARLQADHAATPAVRIIRSEANLGFAAGNNLLFEAALADPACRGVLLLNSDAVAVASGLDACLAEMARGGYRMMGGRMLKPGDAGEVESLGVTLYKSLLASNRKSTADAYLGPTGGFALYARELLEDMRAAHGYVFDPSYFCYAEDTDLCVRARLRGHPAGYVDEVVAYHRGQGSHGADRDEFILYHGIRNSIWMLAKSIPTRIVLTHLHWVLLLHVGIVVRHVLKGNGRTVYRLYRDALAAHSTVCANRRVVQASRTIELGDFAQLIDAKFYEDVYFRNAVRDLFTR